MAIPVGTAVGYLTLDYSQFSRNLKTAVGEATSLSGKFSDTLGQGLKTVGDSITSVGRTLTTGITLPLATATASAIKFGSDFDKQMSAVAAITGATTEDFNKMRTAAIEWGGKTVYTATEAGQALYYMGLAGWDANKSISALGSVLNLGAAGNLELGRTSDIVTDAMTALGLEAGKTTDGIENTTHFVNVMAAAMSNSNTDVDQLGEAFKYVAPLAGALGFKIDDLALALGLMANVGVKSSQAGTGLRQALSQLTNPTDKAREAMDKFNVSLYDNGNAKSLKQFMKDLRKSFGDLEIDIHGANGEVMEGEQIMQQYGNSLPISQQEKLNAIVKIFGVRALPGILGIINQTDESFNSLADAIETSDTAFDGLGAAAGQAAKQTDNLWGDWVRFTSALGTAKIAISDIVKGSLRSFLQRLTQLVNKFNEMPKSQQAFILKIAATVAAIGPLLMIFGKLISGIGSMIIGFQKIREALTLIKVGFDMARVAIQPLIGSLAGMAGPILAVVAVIGILIAAFTNLWKNSEDFRVKITSMWNSVKSAFNEAGQAIVELLNELGFDFEDFKDVVDAVIKGIKSSWNAFCKFLGPIFIQVIYSITSVIKGLVGIFTGIIKTITGLIRGLKTGDWSTFFEGLKKIADSFFTFMTAGLTKLPETIYNMIKTLANYYGVDWSSTWEQAKQKVSDFVTGVVNWFKDLPSKIDSGLKSAATAIDDWFTDIISKAKEGGSNFINKVEESFKDLPYKVGYFIGNTITKVALWVIQMKVKATEAGKSFVDNIINFFKELPAKIKTWLTNTITNIVQFKNDMVQRAKETGRQFIENVINFIKELPGKVKTWLTNTIKNVTQFKNDMIQKAKSAAKGFKDSIVNGVKEIPSKMKEIGNNIVQGVWRGIQNAKATFEANVKSFFKGIVDGAKSALGIKSPSKVMADEVGKFLPPGISEGVEKAMPRAIKDIQKSLDDGVSDLDTNEDVSVSIEGFVNEFQDITNRVTLWFESIEDRLAGVVDKMRNDILSLISMGNMLTTTDGLLYNYRTNMFGGESKENTSNQYKDIIEMLKNIIDIINNDDEGPGGDIVIPVYIGNEQFDTMVVKATNRNDYRSGGR